MKSLQIELLSTNLLLWPPMQSAGINVQSPQSATTPRRLTLEYKIIQNFALKSIYLKSKIGNHIRNNVFQKLNKYISKKCSPNIIFYWRACLQTKICTTIILGYFPNYNFLNSFNHANSATVVRKPRPQRPQRSLHIVQHTHILLNNKLNSTNPNS